MKVLLPIDVLHPYKPLVKELTRLVPLTGSDLKLIYVAESASAFESFLHATGRSTQELDLHLKSRALKILGEVAEELSPTGAVVTADALQGSPAASIEQAAAEEANTLTVINAGHTDSDEVTPLGSTASHVVKHALGTILLLRAKPTKGADNFTRVLIAIDGSEHSLLALRTFVEQFNVAERNIEIALVNVVSIVGVWKLAPVEFVASIEDNLNMAGEAILAEGEKALSRYAVMPKQMFIRTGDIAQEIVKAADDIKADAIVVGAQGRSAVEHLLLGSVSYKLSQHARLPLVIVR